MDLANDGHLRRARAYRENRAAKGLAQVNIWMDEEVRMRLDEVVKAGKFKNRSEAVAAAMQRFLTEAEHGQ